MSPREDAGARRWFGAARKVTGVPSMPAVADLAMSFFFCRPVAGEMIAGFGARAEIRGEDPRSTLDEVMAREVSWSGTAPEGPGPWFGGFAFDLEAGARTEAWAGFGRTRWYLPKVAVIRSGGETWLAGFGETAEEAEATVGAARLLEAAPVRAGTGSLPVVQDRVGWERLVSSALDAIASGALQKVVLARPIDLELDGPAPLEALLQAWVERHPGCAIFCMTTGDGDAFLGATPETLAAVEGGRLEVDALAGTADANGAFSDKDRHEHQVVVDGIRAVLEGRVDASSLDVPAAPSVVTLRNVAHLHTPIRARLRRGVTFGEVALALHPTPALGGTPKARALDFIREREGFDRGWYGGGVGWAGGARARLQVGIRSALIRGRKVRVFVGAGIVAGSDPALEWSETSRKARAVLDVLRGAA